MKKILFLFLTAPMFTAAQGIQFEHGMTWKQIKAKAKTENKHIFMDAFTTWCGPCRYMSSTIFPQDKVGEAFNSNFINVKVQLDTTAKDNAEVKQWYRDAHSIMQSYGVHVFPTYLFFSPEGKLVHRAIGSSEADDFIVKAKNALNPETQYYVQLDKYKGGEKSPEFLRTLAYASRDAYDEANAATIGNEYLKTQSDLLTKDNASFVVEFTQSSRDEGFSALMQNAEQFDNAMGSKAASMKLLNIVEQEELYPKLFSKGAAAPDWKILEAGIAKKYPNQTQEAIATSKVKYYQSKKDWKNFESAIQPYMKKYGADMQPAMLNQFAWNVFDNCPDVSCLKDALEWSHRSLKDKEDPMYMDTYANLSYKLDQKDDAIIWEQKALALAPEGDKSSYQETLDKMRRGEKTWKQ